MSCRPVADVWILARPKLKAGRKYYGAYPAGLLERARFALGVSIGTPVLHVCGGLARYYPYPRGFGPNDRTLDLDPATEPDFLQDARDPWPGSRMCYDLSGWPAILIDPPYSPEDATRYRVGPTVLPKPFQLLSRAAEVLADGGRVGILHYQWARAPKCLRSVGVFPVLVGQGNKVRVFSVFEKEIPKEALAHDANLHGMPVPEKTNGPGPVVPDLPQDRKDDSPEALLGIRTEIQGSNA